MFIYFYFRYFIINIIIRGFSYTSLDKNILAITKHLIVYRSSHLIFSIDPKGCEDVDDTLSVRYLPDGYIELGVHIADVTHFVKPNSLTDIEARNK